jgi:amidase
MAPKDLTATEARAAISAGTLTAAALAESCLEQAAALEPDVHAFAHLGADAALAAARTLDRGPHKGALHGIPFAAKDIIDSHDMPTGYGSPIYKGAQPFTDASPIAVARAAGGVLLGKTVTTEFANLTPNETANPLDLARTPGGSSSGSAAAVAAQMVPLAYGTQTTQSTIRPAAFCGVHGYNPTQGDFRMSGVREAAGTFDRLGLIARSLDDIALLRAVLLNAVPPALQPAKPRIGICRDVVWDDVEPALRSDIDNAAKRLEAAGATVTDMTLPLEFAALPNTHSPISSYEFARNFAFEIDQHWDQISQRLRDGRIATGLKTTLAEYKAALAHMYTCQSMLPALFQDIDVILTPATLGEAPLGLDTTGSAAVGALWTPLFLPCVTLPVFKGPNGMPMGLQVLGPLHSDDAMLAHAKWIEQAL